MPVTKFKLFFETKVPDLDIVKFQQSLPAAFKVTTEKKNIFVIIETPEEEDSNAVELIQRELDRYFFITCVKISAEMVRSVCRNGLCVRWSVHGELPDNILPQQWNSILPLQLRLWSIAVDLHDDYRMKVLYFFQIIELSYPLTEKHYPPYKDPKKKPHERTECKLLRHLIVHAGEISERNKQLKNYCKYLEIPEKMFDLVNSDYSNILKQKVSLLEEQARFAIERNL